MAEKLKPRIPRYTKDTQNNGNGYNNGPLDCGLEGIGERPEICPNNPWRFPEEHKIKICRKCPIEAPIFESSREIVVFPEISQFYKDLPNVYVLVRLGILKTEDLVDFDRVTKAIKEHTPPPPQKDPFEDLET